MYNINNINICKGNNMNYNVKIIDYWSSQHKDLYRGIVALIKSINDTYPQHDAWLREKFFLGLKDGSRKMIVVCNENDLSHPIGVSLLKDIEDEKKICCLFVREDCRGNGVASILMQKSCEVLKTDKPLITVSNRNLSQLQRLLDKNNFTFSYRKKGAYQENDTENYFNNKATEILKTDILPALLASKLRRAKE